MEYSLNKHGKNITTFEISSLIGKELVTLIDSTDTIDLDFNGVETLTSSSVETMLRTSVLKIGVDNIFKKFRFLNTTYHLRVVLSCGLEKLAN